MAAVVSVVVLVVVAYGVFWWVRRLLREAVTVAWCDAYATGYIDAEADHLGAVSVERAEVIRRAALSCGPSRQR